MYSKFKHASQMLDCDQGITSVPIGKLQLLDKFSKGDIQQNLYTQKRCVFHSSDLWSFWSTETLWLTEFGYMRAETLLKF